MNLDELQSYLNGIVPLFSAENVVSTREAQVRCGKFLEAQHYISLASLQLASQLLKLISLRDIKYAQLMSQDTSKNVTEKKVNVEAHPDYVSIREQVDDVESKLSFLKTHTKLQENAHLFFRTWLKGDFNG